MKLGWSHQYAVEPQIHRESRNDYSSEGTPYYEASVISRGLDLRESPDEMAVNYAKQYRLRKKSLFREILSV